MDEQKKKKKSHYFEIYILKVLKQISIDSSITVNAKQQVNSAICIIAKQIASVVLNITIISKKKTVSDKEIKNALSITLSGELLSNSITEGEKAVVNFKEYNSESKVSCKQTKAGILFPPSLVEKFLRNFGYTKIMVTCTAPIYLAAVLEYLTFEILDLSNMYCRENKRMRINIRDIELSIREDKELDELFIKLNINLLGGGVIPFIHPFLLNKLKKKPLKITDKNRRFHSGTVALRNIKKQQKFSDTLIFSKSSFEQFVRQIFRDNNHDDDIKLSKDLFIVVQYFIEQYIVNILRNANYLAIHANRIKLTPTDIGLVSFLNNKSKNPYYDDFPEDINEILSLPDDEDENSS